MGDVVSEKHFYKISMLSVKAGVAWVTVNQFIIMGKKPYSKNNRNFCVLLC